MTFDKSKRLSNDEPSITDFEFIKTLGKGGFATVYMGKYFYFLNNFSEKKNIGGALCYENGKKVNRSDRRCQICVSLRRTQYLS